jgi:hypothetical protein
LGRVRQHGDLLILKTNNVKMIECIEQVLGGKMATAIAEKGEKEGA